MYPPPLPGRTAIALAAATNLAALVAPDGGRRLSNFA